MSAKQLCTLLEDLGLKDATHTPESLAWTCQQEGARLLIKWLCSNITTENVLTLEELAEYNQLKQQGKVLQGEELDEAYWRHTHGNEAEQAELEQAIQDVLEETDDLNEKRRSLERRLDRLQAQARVLEDETAEVAKSKAGQEHFFMKAESRNEDMKAQVGEQAEQLNSIMQRISNDVQQIELNYQGETAGGRPHLLTTSFKPFLKQNNLLQKELDLWYQARFGGGIDDDSTDAGSLFSLSHGAGRGQGKQAHQHRVKELERLGRIFGRAEEQMILATAEQAQQEAELDMANAQFSERKRYDGESEASLRTRTEELKGLIVELKRDKKELRQQVSSLCKELGELNSTFVIEGDYEMKRQRQKYYLEQYHQFIRHLVDQLACHLVLLHACEEEKRAHRDACLVIQAAGEELATVSACAFTRMENYKFLKQADVQASRTASDVINSRANRLEALFRAPSAETNEERSLAGENEVEPLQMDVDPLKEDLDIAQSPNMNTVLVELDKNIEQARMLLFAGPQLHQPEFVPEDILKSMEDLDSLNKSLESAIDRIRSRQQRYHHVLEDMGDSLETERRVFVDFFCNPERLKDTVRDLEQTAKRKNRYS